jgi:hypothetical protein
MCIFHHLIDCCNGLRRRTHLPKRTIATFEGTARKRHRQLTGANSAADGRAAVGDAGVNGFIFKAPGRIDRGKPTVSPSSYDHHRRTRARLILPMTRLPTHSLPQDLVRTQTQI